LKSGCYESVPSMKPLSETESKNLESDSNSIISKELQDRFYDFLMNRSELSEETSANVRTVGESRPDKSYAAKHFPDLRHGSNSFTYDGFVGLCFHALCSGSLGPRRKRQGNDAKDRRRAESKTTALSEEGKR